MTEAKQGTGRHGRLYWCIKTDLSETGEIYVTADHLEVTACGALIAWGSDQTHQGSVAAEALANLVCAPGCWSAAYVASPVDGAGLAIQSWPGEAAKSDGSVADALGNPAALYEVPRHSR